MLADSAVHEAVAARSARAQERQAAERFWALVAEGQAESAFQELSRAGGPRAGAAVLARSEGSSCESVQSVAVAAFERAVTRSDARTASEMSTCMASVGLSSMRNECVIEGAVRAVCSAAQKLAGRGELDARLEDALDNARSASAIVRSVLPENATEGMSQRLERAAIEEVGLARQEQIFEHVVDFPESHGALSDLRECIERAGMRKHACAAVRRALESRLLHAGASTSDVLSVYVSVQRALRVADPTGAVARAGAQPVEAYLRSRQDAHRQVVEALLRGPDADALGSMLEQELRRNHGGDASKGDPADAGNVFGDVGKERSEQWQPPPWEVASQSLLGVVQQQQQLQQDQEQQTELLDESASDLGGRAAPAAATASAAATTVVGQPLRNDAPPQMAGERPDITQPAAAQANVEGMEHDLVLQSDSLAAVAGSMPSKRGEGLVAELQGAIAERALRGRGEWTKERELQAVELLRIRLGEASMGSCEVMVKDLSDSPRYASACKCPEWFEPIIVSEHFWPSLRDDQPELQLPRPVQEAADLMCEEYKRLKAPRKLIQKRSVGVATVDVGGREFTVPAVQAAAITMFEAMNPGEHLTSEHVADQLRVSHKVAHQALNAWVERKVLVKQDRDDFSVRQIAVDGNIEQAIETDEEDEEERAAADEDEEHEDDDAQGESGECAEEVMVQQYVIGMLTNHGALHLDKVHNMLKIFVEGGYSRSRETLRQTMDGLVGSGTLTRDSSGAYRKV